MLKTAKKLLEFIPGQDCFSPRLTELCWQIFEMYKTIFTAVSVVYI